MPSISWSMVLCCIILAGMKLGIEVLLLLLTPLIILVIIFFAALERIMLLFVPIIMGVAEGIFINSQKSTKIAVFLIFYVTVPFVRYVPDLIVPYLLWIIHQ